MAKLTRQDQKVFANNSGASGVAVMGSMKTGTPVYSKDLATIQSTAYDNGWDDAILNDKAPYLEEMNGVQYGLSYQSAYMLQSGVPEYSSTQEYYIGSIVKDLDSNNDVIFYQSTTDNNIGNPLSDFTNWKRVIFQDRAIGQTIFSMLPLNDIGLHLLDGSLIYGSGIYGAFVNYIGNLYNAHTADNCFVSESVWQNAVNANGVCGKFVYDAVNNTVRLPKITGIVEGTIDLNELGNLVDASVPQHGHEFTATTVEAGLHNHGYQLAQQTYGYQGPLIGQGSARLWYVDRATGSAGTHTHAINGTVGNSNQAIYTGNKVQPQTIKGFYYIVVATTTKTDIEVDLDDIASDLNGKADVDLSNCSSSGNERMANMSFPGNYTNLSLGVSGAEYTAPANGWFYLNKIAGSDWNYCSISSVSDGTFPKISTICIGHSTSYLQVNLPVAKGQKVQIDYNATGTTNAFRFVYAIGNNI